MIRSEDSPTIVTIQPCLVEEVLTVPPDAPALASQLPNPTELIARPSIARPDRVRRTTLLQRVATGAALTGFLLLGGEQQAAATPTNEATVQAQESGFNVNTLITGGSVLVAAGALLIAERSRRTQQGDKHRDRFFDALQKVAGTSEAEQLQTQLNVLAIFAEEPQHAPKVCTTAIQHLIARRSAIELIRERIDQADPATLPLLSPVERLDKALTQRRPADREMVKLFFKTLPAAREALREQMQKQAEGKPEDRLQILRSFTGLLPASKEGLIKAANINLDLMRDALVDFDLSYVDFTGAGMQGNNFISVIFEGCDCKEVQLAGTTLRGCDINADFRGAYFSDDPDDPYSMGETIFDGCIVGPLTRFGHLDDNHPKARHHSNNPKEPGAYRGGGKVTMRNLKSYDPSLDIVRLVHSWQREGLKLSANSDPKYLL